VHFNIYDAFYSLCSHQQFSAGISAEIFWWCCIPHNQHQLTTYTLD